MSLVYKLLKELMEIMVLLVFLIIQVQKKKKGTIQDKIMDC
ncbi:unnamed protein product [Paramecium sonneborni]|uniref:Uncharacterized protein n=1 Tax=Paramecium sonneborni TaxID=65129 RepID=A0A8S1MB83_9CILI|nr:unnamed protein product [Paramecium sonneborni]